MEPGSSTRGVAGGCLWALASGALAVALVSLLINVVLVGALLQRRAFLLSSIDQTLVTLEGASHRSVTFNFPISQTIEFEGEIPIQYDFDFPFQSDLPINTTVQVPVSIPNIGVETTIPVPINVTVPIDTSVPVHIDQTFPIKISLPVQMNVPIELSPEQSPLRDWWSGIREWLILLRKQI